MIDERVVEKRHTSAIVYHTRPNAPIPTGCKSVYLGSCQRIEVGTAER